MMKNGGVVSNFLSCYSLAIDSVFFLNKKRVLFIYYVLIQLVFFYIYIPLTHIDS